MAEQNTGKENVTGTEDSVASEKDGIPPPENNPPAKSPLVPPAEAPVIVAGSSGTQDPNAPLNGRTNSGEHSAIDTADEVEYEEKRKSTRRKSSLPKNPPLHAQMSVLMEKLDRQAERTDELFRIIRNERTKE